MLLLQHCGKIRLETPSWNGGVGTSGVFQVTRLEQIVKSPGEYIIRVKHEKGAKFGNVSVLDELLTTSAKILCWRRLVILTPSIL